MGRIGQAGMAGLALALALAQTVGAGAGAHTGDPEVAAAEAEAGAEAPLAPPRVLSQRDAARLRGLQGITLQWISWDKRGEASVTIDEAGLWRLHGSQSGADGAVLVVDGTITEIGPDYFILEGAITIANTPDAGRSCEGQGTWRFAVTQNRQYYRLRTFEWCDHLTDYIDLYF